MLYNFFYYKKIPTAILILEFFLFNVHSGSMRSKKFWKQIFSQRWIVLRERCIEMLAESFSCFGNRWIELRSECFFINIYRKSDQLMLIPLYKESSGSLKENLLNYSWWWENLFFFVILETLQFRFWPTEIRRRALIN